MADNAALAEFKQGIKYLRDAHPNSALVHFRNAVELNRHNPYYISFVGVSLARAERNWAPALNLCETALGMKRNDAQLYLNLAEVYTSAGRRGEALMILDRALVSLGRDARIQRARRKLGSRRPPVLPFLDRENILNKYLGSLRHRLMSRADGAHLTLFHARRPQTAETR